MFGLTKKKIIDFVSVLLGGDCDDGSSEDIETFKEIEESMNRSGSADLLRYEGGILKVKLLECLYKNKEKSVAVDKVQVDLSNIAGEISDEVKRKISDALKPEFCLPVARKQVDEYWLFLAERRGFDNVRKIVDAGMWGSDRLVKPLYCQDNCFYYEFVGVDGHSVTLRNAFTEMSADEVIYAFSESLQGVAALHNKSVIHGDFKPQNILMEPGGGAKLMDYGLSREYCDGNSFPGLDGHGEDRLVGTLLFSSANHYMDDYKKWGIDSYAVGVSLRYLHAKNSIISPVMYQYICGLPDPKRYNDSRDSVLEAIADKLVAFGDEQITVAQACNAIRVELLGLKPIDFGERLGERGGVKKIGR